MRTKLKMKRVEKGLTQKQLADKIGRTQQNYNAVEKGNINSNIEFWKAIQKVLGIADIDMWYYINEE